MSPGDMPEEPQTQTMSPPVPDDFPVSLTFEGSRGYENTRRSHIQADIQAENAMPSPPSLTGPGPTSSGFSPPWSSQQLQGLPSYFSPLPSHLKPIDIEYLRNKGALTVPDDELQRELFQKYIQYVHPFMPILDLPSLLAPIARGKGSGHTSLLVFQAVMFTSAAFIDMDYYIARGQSDRKSVRKMYFERARLLYDQDCESDRMALLQAVLLMTFWYERPEDEKETWYWTGIALSLAQVLGLHRNPEHLDVSPEMKCLRKRIWWSCFVRDRLLALGLRRPARIRVDDFDVPPLTFDDFNIETLEDDLLRYIGPLPLADDTPTKASICHCFIELTHLCVYIGDILSTQYSTLSNPTSESKEHAAMMVLPKKSAEQLQELEKCDKKLESWLQNLNPVCQYKVGQRDQDKSHRILHLHQAQLQMIHLAATVVLHRPRALQPSSGSGEDRASVRQSRNKVANAAAGITEVVYDLYCDNQLRFAPTSAISALLSATLIHLIDVRSSGSEVRYASIGRFYQCWQALHHLRGMYASADHAVWFLEAAIRKTNVQIPMLNLLPSSTKRQQSHRPRSRRTPSISTSVPAAVEKEGPSGQPAVGANTLTTPTSSGPQAVMGTAGEDMVVVAQNGASPVRVSTLLPPSHDPIPHAEMESTIIVDPQIETWGGMDLAENLLQSLIRFDTDPGFYAPTSLEQAPPVPSPSPTHIRYG
ncbi:hypothetical protein FALCPG4_007571 [Fusarium falciforme]